MRLGHLLPALVVALALASPARATVLIEVDKAKQQMTVTVDGNPLYIWPVSTGQRRYDTPAGDFQPFRMERHHFSREWDDAPMPYSIFFTQEGHAIHGSYEVRRLGTPASHGCVRLSPENAATLFALVKQQGVKNARVVLTGEAPTQVAARSDNSIIEDEPEARPRKSRRTSVDEYFGRSYTRERPYYVRRYYYGGSPFSAIFGGRW
jgi:hypothetical protein